MINETRRREWLRALRRFKYGIKVRAKIGVLQTICEQVAQERKGSTQWSAPDWDNDKWVTYLYTCIKDGEFPPKLLIGFAESAEVTFLNPRKQPRPQDVVDFVNEVCRRLSKRLRQKFGVFT